MKSSQVWKRWYLENLALNGARMIYQGGDNTGPIRVVDLGPFRELYFNSPSCQGRIHRQRPWIPASDYITSMVFGALLAPKLKRVLVLGLGPGAIVHTLKRMDPSLQIDTVEVREEVIKLAKELFNAPQGEEVQHIHTDCARFFKRYREEALAPYDYVIVDLAISEGPSPLVTQPAFWSEMRSLLNADGVLCINLWRGKEHLFDWTVRQMTQCFSQEPLSVEHKHIENIIAFSSPSKLEDEQVKEALKRLVGLRDHLELNLRGGLEFLLRQMMELSSALSDEAEAPRDAGPLKDEVSEEPSEVQPPDETDAENPVRIDPYDPSSPPEGISPEETSADD